MDTHLFIEIVCSEGARLLYEEELEGIVIGYYHGRTGKKVQIITSDESIGARTMASYLNQLGMSELVERLVPLSTGT